MKGCCDRHSNGRSTSGTTSKPSLRNLPSAYAFGLAKNHAFVDGNKRIAFMSMMTFLRKNGVRFAPDQAHATKIILALAAGEVSEENLARWIRDNWPKA